MPIRCLVFDCDGVLLDSVPVKTNAFARLAEPFGEEAKNALLAYHKAHGGVSRYQKFAWFFETVLGRAVTKEENDAWAKRFNAICLEELPHCGLIAGAKECVRALHGKLPLYVCSGAPAQEQRALLHIHGLDQFFEDIYGSPPAKGVLLQQIVVKAKVLAEETLMVGDARTDYEAAQLAQTQFYGVGEELRGLTPWAADLTELAAYVQKHL